MNHLTYALLYNLSDYILASLFQMQEIWRSYRFCAFFFEKSVKPLALGSAMNPQPLPQRPEVMWYFTPSSPHERFKDLVESEIACDGYSSTFSLRFHMLWSCYPLVGFRLCVVYLKLCLVNLEYYNYRLFIVGSLVCRYMYITTSNYNQLAIPAGRSLYKVGRWTSEGPLYYNNLHRLQSLYGHRW